MAKEKNEVASPLLRNLFQLGVYKRTQGKIARQVTFATLAIIILVGGYRLYIAMRLWHVGHWFNATPDNVDAIENAFRVGMAGLLVLLGWWIAYRLVNMPSFADFLIAVEAEMNKVSWPTRAELVRSSLVVIFSILFLTVVLYGYDVFWNTLLKQIGVIHAGG